MKSEQVLTKREWQVLEKIVEGKTDKEIAKEFSISYRTVDRHIRNIFGKLGVHKRTQAAVYYALYYQRGSKSALKNPGNPL